MLVRRNCHIKYGEDDIKTKTQREYKMGHERKHGKSRPWTGSTKCKGPEAGARPTGNTIPRGAGEGGRQWPGDRADCGPETGRTVARRPGGLCPTGGVAFTPTLTKEAGKPGVFGTEGEMV